MVKAIQRCVSCKKFRELDEHNCWSHWKPPYQFRAFTNQDLIFVKCEHCKKFGAPPSQEELVSLDHLE